MGKKVTETVSEDTLKTLKKKNLKLRFNILGKSKANKYSKETRLLVFKGYDLLENMIVVRQYIQKKNNIDLGLLEVLLYLFPKPYFTQADYASIPKQFRYGSIRNLMATGFVSIVQEGSDLGKNLYKVNRKGHEIVCNFYELLSGEKKISDTRYENPLMNKKTRTPFDKKRMDLIKKINLLPAPESKKGLYQ